MDVRFLTCLDLIGDFPFGSPSAFGVAKWNVRNIHLAVK